MKRLMILPLTATNKNRYSIIDLIEKIDLRTFDIDLLVIDTTDEERINRILELNNIPYIKSAFSTDYINSLQMGISYAHENDYDYAIEFDPSGRLLTDNINYIIKVFESNNLDILTTTRFGSHNKKGHRTFRCKALKRLIKGLQWIDIMDVDNPLKIYGKNALRHFDKQTWFIAGPTTIPNYVNKIPKGNHMDVQIESNFFGDHSFDGFVKRFSETFRDIMLLTFIIPFKRRRSKND